MQLQLVILFVLLHATMSTFQQKDEFKLANVEQESPDYLTVTEFYHQIHEIQKATIGIIPKQRTISNKVIAEKIIQEIVTLYPRSIQINQLSLKMNQYTMFCIDQLAQAVEMWKNNEINGKQKLSEKLQKNIKIYENLYKIETELVQQKDEEQCNCKAQVSSMMSQLKYINTKTLSDASNIMLFAQWSQFQIVKIVKNCSKNTNECKQLVNKIKFSIESYNYFQQQGNIKEADKNIVKLISQAAQVQTQCIETAQKEQESLTKLLQIGAGYQDQQRKHFKVKLSPAAKIQRNYFQQLLRKQHRTPNFYNLKRHQPEYSSKERRFYNLIRNRSNKSHWLNKVL